MPKRPAKNTDDRVTYRDLRNTPGRVFERLADNEVLTLVADGEPKAILVPIKDGDVRGAYEAYARGRAMLAAARIRRGVRESARGPMSISDINALIHAARRARDASDD